MMQTLNELAHLRDSGFGQPWPRHGLKLLYWFANDCVSFGNDNVMISECDPADGDFGFHHFENRYDENGDKLLPDMDFPYYVVGNLNSPGAEELPEYISDKYNYEYNINTDRIIVSLYDEEWFHRVYVTQHHDRSNDYDPNSTYRISRGLLMIIRRMSLEHFLGEMDYFTSILPIINYRPQTTNTFSLDFTAVTPSSSDSDDSESPAATQLDDNKMTDYCAAIQPILPMPVTSYRPQTTHTDFTAVSQPSSGPAHHELRNYNKIQIDNDKKTGYYPFIQPFSPTPAINYSPQTTNTSCPDFTAVTPSSSDSDDSESSATKNNDTIIQIHDDTPTLNPSEKLPKKKGLCRRFCTIL
ncbi:hypothetical protein DPX16_23285 [Anabarilius grahami]|uniref:Uncharacterized protein n=1 Tax=Anabarilius grahami TaxID=495550 RepID=A0A3N0Z8Y6_ANAGA|nr:hypothetical protein DPX16_23285 [Anabarilius grahami]